MTMILTTKTVDGWSHADAVRVARYLKRRGFTHAQVIHDIDDDTCTVSVLNRCMIRRSVANLEQVDDLVAYEATK